MSIAPSCHLGVAVRCDATTVSEKATTRLFYARRRVHDVLRSMLSLRAAIGCDAATVSEEVPVISPALGEAMKSFRSVYPDLQPGNSTGKIIGHILRLDDGDAGTTVDDLAISLVLVSARCLPDRCGLSRCSPP